jgi:hypothetical protein
MISAFYARGRHDLDLPIGRLLDSPAIVRLAEVEKLLRRKSPLRIDAHGGIRVNSV